jgi:hypothetical protein
MSFVLGITLNIIELPTKSFDEVLGSMLKKQITPHLLLCIRHAVTNEMRLKNAVETFWVCHREHEDQVKILNEKAFRRMIARWYDEPMIEDNLMAIEKVEHLAKCGGWTLA